MAGPETSPLTIKNKYKHLIIRPLPLLDSGEIDPVALVIESSVVSENVLIPLQDEQKDELLIIIGLLEESEDFSMIKKDWCKFIVNLDKTTSATDLFAIIQWASKEAYAENLEDLNDHAERVHYYDSTKKSALNLKDKLVMRQSICNCTNQNPPNPLCVQVNETCYELASAIKNVGDSIVIMEEDAQKAKSYLETKMQVEVIGEIVEQMSTLVRQMYDSALSILQDSTEAPLY